MIAIVDYGVGNVRSVANTLALLGASSVLTKNPEDFAHATHIIFPGVGAFEDGMDGLRKSGVIKALTHEVQKTKKPFLGICLGMQLLTDRGEEGTGAAGLGWVAGTTRRLRVDESMYRLPHIGWNDVTFGDHPLFANIDGRDFYFVHSYVVEPTDMRHIIGTCEYGAQFAAAVQRDNIFGVQFHPEKSQKSGQQLLRNFINM
ncbi:imidazole glycerol phosphate synthase, glutamine amidotransferase subunit [Candidatus Kaiserbacteria bacterium RIFCSPHIGHO2_01_FULL_53_29]|uniref:Imidazole glycerol phosphate synthase subunit HisH n=1 Tax=Candidatus Kaiserbacteria bacterium RIFCSPHIGHO2_01_FULL_53_29 TaxID=1798480 RepID=A0A1F6CXC7_9BACT|nr:MAG: imidazole glycerol phosphate synthase, glutamine amidotransferase subunit [Candidatus Kaiserbacteria bacterium RIFCSPHIGHO2_01_FULL_53_29]